MFRYLILIFAIIGVLSLPVMAQDKSKSDQPETIAPMATFAIMVVNICDGENKVDAMRVMEEGQIACRHRRVLYNNQVETLADYKKTTMVEVETKLKEEELTELNEAFSKLELASLKSSEIDPSNPPEKFITIVASDGHRHVRYISVLSSYGADAEKVTNFIKVVTKIMDRLN